MGGLAVGGLALDGFKVFNAAVSDISALISPVSSLLLTVGGVITLGLGVIALGVVTYRRRKEALGKAQDEVAKTENRIFSILAELRLLEIENPELYAAHKTTYLEKFRMKGLDEFYEKIKGNDKFNQFVNWYKKLGTAQRLEFRKGTITAIRAELNSKLDFLYRDQLKSAHKSQNKFLAKHVGLKDRVDKLFAEQKIETSTELYKAINHLKLNEQEPHSYKKVIHQLVNSLPTKNNQTDRAIVYDLLAALLHEASISRYEQIKTRLQCERDILAGAGPKSREFETRRAEIEKLLPGLSSAIENLKESQEAKDLLVFSRPELTPIKVFLNNDLHEQLTNASITVIVPKYTTPPGSKLRVFLQMGSFTTASSGLLSFGIALFIGTSFSLLALTGVGLAIIALSVAIGLASMYYYDKYEQREKQTKNIVDTLCNDHNIDPLSAEKAKQLEVENAKLAEENTRLKREKEQAQQIATNSSHVEVVASETLAPKPLNQQQDNSSTRVTEKLAEEQEKHKQAVVKLSEPSGLSAEERKELEDLRKKNTELRKEKADILNSYEHLQSVHYTLLDQVSDHKLSETAFVSSIPKKDLSVKSGMPKETSQQPGKTEGIENAQKIPTGQSSHHS